MSEPLQGSLVLQAGKPTAEFIAYPQRWIVLTVFSLASFTNAFAWIMFSPIQQQSADYFQTSATGVNFFRLVAGTQVVSQTHPAHSNRNAVWYL